MKQLYEEKVLQEGKRAREKEERKMEMESKRQKRGEERIGKGEQVKKRERGKEKQGEEVEQNGRTLLKFSKKKLSFSQDYPPLNNSVFFIQLYKQQVYF